MSARGVRVLKDYDPEYGVIVAGTDDVAVALPLAVSFELDRQGLDPTSDDQDTEESRTYAETWMLRTQCVGWYRKAVQGPYQNGEGYVWILTKAEPHARGAFRAVEFPR